MSNAANETHPIDKRCREAHPEYIRAGHITWERNDITAKRYGETERTTNGRDKHGAPYRHFGGIKYRPLPDYDEFIASGIRRQQPLRPKRRRRSLGVRDGSDG
jgi:hypothetical protein